MCTPSRSVIYTGQHIQHTRMFDNTNFPWIQSMSTDIRTVGDMLREAGYYTAYKGKWHLTKEFETVNKLGTPDQDLHRGDGGLRVLGLLRHRRHHRAHAGRLPARRHHRRDGAAAGCAARAANSRRSSKPWFLAVNLVNPHDVMFYDTDAPGTPVQSARGITHVARDPVDPLYAKQWEFDLPASHAQPLDAPGRPAGAPRLPALARRAGRRHSRTRPARWRRRHNYYLNCLRDADRNIAAVLAELDAAGLTDRTIVILTADHGDMDGAHQLHAKGAVAYREQNNVPLIIAHPAYAGGRQCRAVTSHLDLAPTLVVADRRRRRSSAPPSSRGLPGKDLSGLLAAPEQAGVNAVRDGVLFNYNMFAYLDGDFLLKAVEHMQQGGNPKKLKAAGIVPDMRKRGAVRSVYDGRYVFSRYFSPKQHNRPTTLEDLYRLNDVELFDLQADPLRDDQPRGRGEAPRATACWR